MIRLGLLGCGRIGQIHGRNAAASPNARLVALYDPFEDNAEKLAAVTGAERRDLEGITMADDIDAVMICTPTTTHFDIIHQCVAGKKAIFCEKPVDLSYDRSLQCVDAAKAAGLPFMVAFNRRFDPNFAALKNRITDCAVGNVEMVTILSRDPAPAPLAQMKDSGGLFRDMMIHDFDMARFLLGEEPVHIFATGSVMVDSAIGDIGDVDTAAVTMKTATGKICQISNSRRASYGYDQRIEVHGSDGMLRADNIHESSVELATKNGFQRAPAQHFFLERYERAYQAELQHFINSLEGNIAMTPTGEDGLRAQILADTATRSCLEGVALPV